MAAGWMHLIRTVYLVVYLVQGAEFIEAFFLDSPHELMFIL